MLKSALKITLTIVIALNFAANIIAKTKRATFQNETSKTSLFLLLFSPVRSTS